MTPEVVTLTPSTTLEEACVRLSRAGISGAPVVEGGRVVGVLSETDILLYLKRVADAEVAGRYLTSETHSLAILALLSLQEKPLRELLQRLLTAMVKDAMTRGAVTARADSPVEEVFALMVRHDINRVPVVDKGKLVGIITRADVIGLFGKAGPGKRPSRG
jgi:CBS domain-containing protein